MRLFGAIVLGILAFQGSVYAESSVDYYLKLLESLNAQLLLQKDLESVDRIVDRASELFKAGELIDAAYQPYQPTAAESEFLYETAPFADNRTMLTPTEKIHAFRNLVYPPATNTFQNPDSPQIKRIREIIRAANYYYFLCSQSHCMGYLEIADAIRSGELWEKITAAREERRKAKRQK